MKADRDDLEYQLRNDFREIVEEIVQKLTKDEF
jgi:predicted transcriptional regulator